MARNDLTEPQWRALVPHLPSDPTRGQPWSDHGARWIRWVERRPMARGVPVPHLSPNSLVIVDNPEAQFRITRSAANDG